MVVSSEQAAACVWFIGLWSVPVVNCDDYYKLYD